MWFLGFQLKSKKHMDIFGFSAEIQKNTWTFLDFQQKSKKTHGHFWIFSRNPKKHMEIFGFSAEIQKTHRNFWIFRRNPKKAHGHFWIFSRNPKEHMEIQNFQKFLVRPIILEILEFLKFWYVVTTESPLFKKLLIKSLYKVISGHVFRIRDLIDFYFLSIFQSFLIGIYTRNTEKFVENQGSP